MLLGPEVDVLVLLVTGGVLAAGFALAVRARPRLAVVAWLCTIAFVPYWLGVSVGPYLPPATALAAVAVVALVARRALPLRAPDLVMAVVVLVTVMAEVLGYVSVHAVFVVVMDWGLAYLLARLLSVSVDLRWLYGAAAVVMTVAAGLALLEFAAGTNPFVQLPAVSGPGSWRALQERGGILRAEGAFGHSIALGASIALTLPLVLASRLRPGVKAGSVAVLLAAAVVTFSRIGIICSVLALVLCIVFLRNPLGVRLRLLLLTALAAGAVVALPYVERVFEAAGREAAGSAAYRGDLLVLVPTMQFIGTASSAERSAEGVLTFGGFRSIDSALVYAGLTYGLLITGLLCLLYVAAVAVLLQRDASGPVIAVVAQLPAVLTVAFITQYSAYFWFVAGLAVSAYAQRTGREALPAARAATVGTAPATDTGGAGSAGGQEHPAPERLPRLHPSGRVPAAASSPSARGNPEEL